MIGISDQRLLILVPDRKQVTSVTRPPRLFQRSALSLYPGISEGKALHSWWHVLAQKLFHAEGIPFKGGGDQQRSVSLGAYYSRVRASIKPDSRTEYSALPFRNTHEKLTRTRRTRTPSVNPMRNLADASS